MKNVKTRRPPTAVLIAIAAVVVLVGSTVAWLTFGDAITNRAYSLSNFDAYAEVYFMDGATKITPTKDINDGSIEVNYTTPGAANYIGKLRVDAYFKGRGWAYLRLKTVQQWQDSSNKILQADTVIPYAIDSPFDPDGDKYQPKWFDNRTNDYCIYYADRLKAANDANTPTPIIISGFDSAKLASIAPAGSGITLKIAFTLEAVQVNRYPQFWGIERLPWLPPVETTTAQETTG